MSEFLGGLKLAKSFNAEPRFIGDLHRSITAMRGDFSLFLRQGSLGSIAFQVSSAIVLSIFVYVGLRYFKLPMAELVVLIFVFSRMSPRFSSLQFDAQELLSNLPAFSSTQKLKSDCDLESDGEQPEAPEPVPLREAVEFSGVSYSYSADPERRVLRDVNFTVPAGKVTALIGPSGSGKSTVADLLLGLLEPDTGEIRVDGLPLAGSSRRNWRSQVA